MLLALLTWGPQTLATSFLPEPATTGSSESVRFSLSERWDVILVGVGLLLYLALKTHAAGPTNTDENIYFYMAQRLAEGEWP